jgi:hypothetical protein
MHKVRIFLFTFFVIASTSAFACSCKKNNVEGVAHTSDIVLTKLKVSTPSITERARSLLSSMGRSRIYSVQVLENYKEAFTANTISVDTNIVGSGGCGVAISYGDTLNVVAYKDSEGMTSNGVGICNIVSDDFAEKVRQEIKNPNEAYKSVDTSSWLQFHKSNAQTFLADTKRVTKDEYGSYIWVLLNDSAANVKSQKTKIHISCKEKMFIVDHEVSFSDFNASGKILNASNFGRQVQYQWIPLTDIYTKLLSYTC